MERREIAIYGTVQGVGFRPFVYGLASRLELGGFVKNQAGGVQIEVEGEASPLDQFLDQLVRQSPPLARIEKISCERRTPLGESRFRIESSVIDALGPVVIAPDIATCDQCLAELFDPRDRRFGYPFLNCTNCGPRLTIVRGAPYDRQRTTMASFVMCPACRAEYDDPKNRRFHAQPTACAVCGPRLQLLDPGGRVWDAQDALAVFAEALNSGKIGALKGLGGYHLACDAENADAVAQLRRRKHRDEKPFAVMVRDAAAAEKLCEMTPAERELLESPERPIVLLQKREGIGVARQVAPDNPFLGVLLPCTPLHHLLLRKISGGALVMTSGNRSDEPIAIDEADAVERLRGIADLFLVHNRPIHVRCDDSVVRVMGKATSPLRRSRGYAPRPIALPVHCPAVILAVGGQLKSTFALGGDGRAILSHHLGDLDHFEASRAFERDIALYEKLFALKPACIARDLHPDYASTRYALRRAAEEGIPCVAVQHHHAHMASCMAEHGLDGPVIGVSFDGTGLGTDGAIWGGEFLIGDYRDFQRAAHLRYVGMPGGEQAVREPWRMAAAHLMDAQADCAEFERRVPASSLLIARGMLARHLNSPQTSSAGRLFDAVASLAGLRDAVAYEGQAAMQLEWLAAKTQRDEAYPFDLPDGNPIVIDTRPLIRAVARDVDDGISASRIARRFHESLVELIAAVCARLGKSTGIDAVTLSGGVFMNTLLTVEVDKRLREGGFRIYRHIKVPPNDGSLSLGQIAVAASRLTA